MEIASYVLQRLIQILVDLMVLSVLALIHSHLSVLIQEEVVNALAQRQLLMINVLDVQLRLFLMELLMEMEDVHALKIMYGNRLVILVSVIKMLMDL
jgi:hypothetical protein